MDDKDLNKTDGAPEGDAVNDNADSAAASEDTPWGDAPSEAESGAPSPAEDLAAENAKIKDQLLRALAEMENLRRRTERDVKDASSYAIASFARDMLNVSDNLRRAMEAIPEDALNQGDAAFKALHDGVEMTERDLLRALEKHGIKQLYPEKERFDPNYHQAMFEIDDPSVPAGTVLQVVQAGYVIGERVLRPAMVGVSRGGAKQPRPKEAADPPAQEAGEPAAEQAKAPEAEEPGTGTSAGQTSRGARAASETAHPQPGDGQMGGKVDKSA